MSDSREKTIYRVTIIGGIGNLLLVVFKFLAGFLGRSSAMVADAVHSLSDLISDVVVVVFVHISSKPSDKEHKYGHGKFETLATAIIGIALGLVGLKLFYDGGSAIIRCIEGEQLPEPGMIALVAALVSIVVKEILYQYTVRVGRKIKSPVVEANAWHHRSDALSSVGTALGIGGAILLGPRWRVLDPVAAVVVSVLIIKVAIDLIKPCIDELVEKSLPPETEEQILDVISEFPEISQPHNMRTRKIGNAASVDVHVRMDGEMTVNQSHEVTRQLEKRLRELLGSDTYVSIHVEPRRADK